MVTFLLTGGSRRSSVATCPFLFGCCTAVVQCIYGTRPFCSLACGLRHYSCPSVFPLFVLLPRVSCFFRNQWAAYITGSGGPFFIYFVFCDLCALLTEELACIPCLLGRNLFICFNYTSWFLAEFFCFNHISSFFWVSPAFSGFSGFCFKQIEVSSHGFYS